MHQLMLDLLFQDSGSVGDAEELLLLDNSRGADSSDGDGPLSEQSRDSQDAADHVNDVSGRKHARIQWTIYFQFIGHPKRNL